MHTREYLLDRGRNGFTAVVPRLLADFVGNRPIESLSEYDMTVSVDHVQRPCLPIDIRVFFIPIVPREVVTFDEMRILIGEHALEAGKSFTDAAIEVAATFDWLLWCVFMGDVCWCPTRDEQDPVWHRLLDKPYFGRLVDFFGDIAYSINGREGRPTIEHIKEHDLDDGTFRLVDQQAVMERCHVPLAPLMARRALAECESAVRYAS
ncbi:MAG: hypothetical protein NUV56_01995 [Candidatus Uhrbacteria bacterium]|nr:hypothetical protein [Candidatus Uhrbacteria bacterium]